MSVHAFHFPIPEDADVAAAAQRAAAFMAAAMSAERNDDDVSFLVDAAMDDVDPWHAFGGMAVLAEALCRCLDAHVVIGMGSAICQIVAERAAAVTLELETSHEGNAHTPEEGP